MDKKLFGELAESMKQMNEIVQGKRAPSRRFVVNATSVKKLRSKLGLRELTPSSLASRPVSNSPVCSRKTGTLLGSTVRLKSRRPLTP